MKRSKLTLAIVCLGLAGFLFAANIIFAQTPTPSVPTPVNGTTPNTAANGGNTAVNGTTPTTSGGALLNSMKKPGDYATQALDTSNFLQDTATYGWAADVWQAMRQMSNILIVVFLFIGALATTLNYNLNTYGIKRVLPSVIQAAILANFSYIVINAAIEVIGLTQKGLLGIGIGGASVNQSTWATLAAPLKVILDGMQPTASSGIGALGWGLIATLGVAVAMLLLWLVVGILYLRSFILAMLVAFAPLAILSMALPATQGIWKKWWDEFLKWLLLPLVVCFWLMVASLIASLGLPAMLKTLVVMFAVFQGVKAPFSFKPAIAGAAIGYGAAQLTGYGKYLGERAAYGNNVTGGTLRGIDRWKQGRAASLSAMKDSSTVIKGVRENAPGPNASWLAKARYTVGLRGRVGRRLNSEFEAIDSNVEELKTREGISRTQAKQRADSHRNLGSNQSRGQRRAGVELAQEQAEASLGRQGEEDRVAAAEADPEILQNIAALNQSKEALSNAMESLKTGAKAAALASNESLKTEKKLSEFRKNEAANLLKQIEAGINSDALNENSPLGQNIKTHLAGNHQLREALKSYGVHINNDGSGYVEGMMQNELNGISATEAYEGAVKKQHTLIAARDSSRHMGIVKGFETNAVTGTSIATQADILNNLDNVYADDTQRQAAAEHLEKQLRSTLTPEQFEQYGMSNLVSTVQSGPKADADELLARAINIYRVTDMASLSPAAVPGVTSPVSEDALKAARSNRMAAALRQGKMVREDIQSGSQTLSETTFPEARLRTYRDKIARTSAEILPGGSPPIDSLDVTSTHALGGSEGLVDNRLVGTTHHDLMNDTTKMIRSWKKDALSGDNGEPSIKAIQELSNYLDTINTSLIRYQSAFNPASPQYAVANTAMSEALSAKTDIDQAMADYQAAESNNDIGQKQTAKSALRRALGNQWLAKIS